MKYLSFLLLLFSMNACADSSDCATKATQTELNLCAGKKLDTTENILKNEIIKLSEIIPDDDDFKKANELWRKYRDSHCTSVSNIYDGGSIHHYVEANCKIALTEKRIEELKSDYSDTIDIITKGAP